MTKLLTGAQMKAVEAAAIASGFVTGTDLMERAGKGVVDAILAEWPEAARGTHRAVVLCGPGGNGGDGFVIARLLLARGWLVKVWFLGQRDCQPPDAAKAHDRWIAAGGAVFAIPQPFLPDAKRPGEMFSQDVFGGHAFVIDALFGHGLTRPIAEDSGLWQAFAGHFDEAVREEDVCVHHVAVDVPSGLCADSGRIISPAGRANFRPHFQAALTVATGSLKLGHFLDEGPECCGKVVLAEIGPLGGLGIGKPGCRDPAEGAARLVTEKRAFFAGMIPGYSSSRSLAKAPRFAGSAHKYDHGHALVLSGGSGRGGAARLAARGALRIGAGVVTVGCPFAALAENAARLDAVMLQVVADRAALARMLSDCRINVLCIGPGFGMGEREADLLAQVLCRPPPPPPPHKGEGRDTGQAALMEDQVLSLPLVGRGEGWGDAAPGWRGLRPTVLDADALTILSHRPDLFVALHGACVLTPHLGEFGRLFPDIAAKLAAPATRGPVYSKVDATREAAKRAGCVVLCKGADTVIAGPDGRCEINSAAYDRPAPWLATAGSGDVLAGFITGLLARGFDPFEAACSAAWLHVECARAFGPGLIAEDLPDMLPQVFRAMGL